MSFLSGILRLWGKEPTLFPGDSPGPAPLAFLRAVEQMVYSRFSYENDPANHWKMPSEMLDRKGILRGDCEDYATACKAVLDIFGIPSRYVYCTTETGREHMVLEVKGWIFDERYPGVVSRDTLPYQWKQISEFGVLLRPRKWTTL